MYSNFFRICKIKIKPDRVSRKGRVMSCVHWTPTPCKHLTCALNTERHGGSGGSAGSLHTDGGTGSLHTQTCATAHTHTHTHHITAHRRHTHTTDAPDVHTPTHIHVPLPLACISASSTYPHISFPHISPACSSLLCLLTVSLYLSYTHSQDHRGFPLGQCRHARPSHIRWAL